MRHETNRSSGRKEGAEEGSRLKGTMTEIKTENHFLDYILSSFQRMGLSCIQ